MVSNNNPIKSNSSIHSFKATKENTGTPKHKNNVKMYTDHTHYDKMHKENNGSRGVSK